MQYGKNITVNRGRWRRKALPLLGRERQAMTVMARTAVRAAEVHRHTHTYVVRRAARSCRACPAADCYCEQQR